MITAKQKNISEKTKLIVKLNDDDFRLKIAYLLDDKIFLHNSTEINKRLVESKSEAAMNEAEEFDGKELLTNTHDTTLQGFDAIFNVQYGVAFDLSKSINRNGMSNFNCNKKIAGAVFLIGVVREDFAELLKKFDKAVQKIEKGRGNNYFTQKIIVYSNYDCSIPIKDFKEHFIKQDYCVYRDVEIENVRLPKYEKKYKFNSDVYKFLNVQVKNYQ